MKFFTNEFTYEYPFVTREIKTKALVAPAFDTKKVIEIPKHEDFIALWDTGATNSMITNKVVQKCNLRPSGKAFINTAGGPITTFTYLISLGIYVTQGTFGMSAIKVAEVPHLIGADILIGMDVISRGDFAITNKDGKTVFSFRIPSMERIDFSRRPLKIKEKIGRNTPCPCGSGKKYKNCHGK